MTSQTFYLWTTTVSWDPSLQHTFVTTYDPVTTCAPSSGLFYWYCWGDCHTNAGKNAPVLYASQSGDTDIGTCLTAANDSASTIDAHGGIPSFYGHYGVCHQVANRTLYATAQGGSPLELGMSVHGYHLSHWLYGGYATKGHYQGTSMSKNWQDRKAACQTGGTMAPTNDDEEQVFRGKLEDVLGAEFNETMVTEIEGIFTDLRHKKDALADRVLSKDISHVQFANAVNELLTEALPFLASIVGEAHAEKIFDFVPGKPVVLLDPQISAREDSDAVE